LGARERERSIKFSDSLTWSGIGRLAREMVRQGYMTWASGRYPFCPSFTEHPTCRPPTCTFRAFNDHLWPRVRGPHASVRLLPNHRRVPDSVSCRNGMETVRGFITGPFSSALAWHSDCDTTAVPLKPGPRGESRRWSFVGRRYRRRHIADLDVPRSQKEEVRESDEAAHILSAGIEQCPLYW